MERWRGKYGVKKKKSGVAVGCERGHYYQCESLEDFLKTIFGKCKTKKKDAKRKKNGVERVISKINVLENKK